MDQHHPGRLEGRAVPPPAPCPRDAARAGAAGAGFESSGPDGSRRHRNCSATLPDQSGSAVASAHAADPRFCTLRTSGSACATSSRPPPTMCTAARRSSGRADAGGHGVGNRFNVSSETPSGPSVDPPIARMTIRASAAARSPEQDRARTCGTRARMSPALRRARSRSPRAARCARDRGGPAIPIRSDRGLCAASSGTVTDASRSSPEGHGRVLGGGQSALSNRPERGGRLRCEVE